MAQLLEGDWEIGDKAQQSPTGHGHGHGHGLIISSVCELEMLEKSCRHIIPHIHALHSDSQYRLGRLARSKAMLVSEYNTRPFMLLHA